MRCQYFVLQVQCSSGYSSDPGLGLVHDRDRRLHIDLCLGPYPSPCLLSRGVPYHASCAVRAAHACNLPYARDHLNSHRIPNPRWNSENMNRCRSRHSQNRRPGTRQGRCRRRVPARRHDASFCIHVPGREQEDRDDFCNRLHRRPRTWFRRPGKQKARTRQVCQ